MDRFSHLCMAVEEHRPTDGTPQVKILSDAIAINTRTDLLEVLKHPSYRSLGLDEGCGVMCMETDGELDLTAIYLKEGANFEPARSVLQEIVDAREAAKPPIPPATNPPGSEPPANSTSSEPPADPPSSEPPAKKQKLSEEDATDEGVRRKSEGMKGSLEKKMSMMAAHMSELETHIQELTAVNEDLTDENASHENHESELERENVKIKNRMIRLEALVKKVQESSDVFGQSYVAMRDDLLL